MILFLLPQWYTRDITAVFSTIVNPTNDTATATAVASTIDAATAISVTLITSSSDTTTVTPVTSMASTIDAATATPTTSKAPISDITTASISSTTITTSMFTYT